MSEKDLPRCKIKLKKGKTSSWKIEIDDNSTECLTSLKLISQKLGPHGRKYLTKRIETSNPDVKKTLKELGFNCLTNS